MPRGDRVVVDLGPRPYYEFFIEVKNRAPFEIELDRASFIFNCGGHYFNSAVLEKQKIPANEKILLRVNEIMPNNYADAVAVTIHANGVSIAGNIEFNCKVRPFARRINALTGIEPKLPNLTHRKVVPLR